LGQEVLPKQTRSAIDYGQSCDRENERRDVAE